MKKYFLLIITIVALSQLSTYAQAPPDSILKKYVTSSSKEKSNVISSYLNYFNKNDSQFIKKSLELIKYFEKQNDDKGAHATKFFLMRFFTSKNDFVTALDIAFPFLSKSKKKDYRGIRDYDGMVLALNVIVGVYYETKNYTEAIKYLKELTAIDLRFNDKKSLSNNYNWIGAIYATAFMPDSGLAYSQQSVNIDNELKDSFHLKFSLSTLAENYIARGDYDLAMPFLKKAILIYKDSSIGFYEYIYNDYAQAYLGMKKYDSSIYYAHQSLSFSVRENYISISDQQRSYEYLYKAFDAMGRQDSSNKYFRLGAVLKDSIFSIENVKAIEVIGYRDLMRQINAKDERKQIIQYALIVLGIVTFILLFFLFSRSIVVTEKWISFFGILGLLIIFEFINLLIHPFLEEKTDHSPILMLLALVAIASLLIPMHHRIEKWIKDKITKKNKTIRLEHAKKTIEQLNEKHIQTKDENE